MKRCNTCGCFETTQYHQSICPDKPKVPWDKLLKELLPCPFCGSKNAQLNEKYYTDHNDKPASVSCLDCGASNRLENWNNRFVDWVNVNEKLPEEYEPVLIWRMGIPIHHTPLGWVVNGTWSLCDVMRPCVVDKWCRLPSPPER